MYEHVGAHTGAGMAVSGEQFISRLSHRKFPFASYPTEQS